VARSGRPFRLAFASIAVACALAAAADVELVLLDGRSVRGVEVRRDGALYVLVDSSGGTTTFPVEIVSEVRLAAAGGPPIEGFKVTEPRVLAGDPTPHVPVTPDDQLRVFGEPARFQEGPIDSTWVPENDWPGTDPRYDEEHKARWAKAPIDPSWTPSSAWEGKPDAMAASRSSFQSSIVNSDWRPTDGFQN
jgi:hypothetical protein